jgi:hypothetical protein
MQNANASKIGNPTPVRWIELNAPWFGGMSVN